MMTPEEFQEMLRQIHPHWLAAEREGLTWEFTSLGEFLGWLQAVEDLGLVRYMPAERFTRYLQDQERPRPAGGRYGFAVIPAAQLHGLTDPGQWGTMMMDAMDDDPEVPVIQPTFWTGVWLAVDPETLASWREHLDQIDALPGISRAS